MLNAQGIEPHPGPRKNHDFCRVEENAINDVCNDSTSISQELRDLQYSGYQVIWPPRRLRGKTSEQAVSSARACHDPERAAAVEVSALQRNPTHDAALKDLRELEANGMSVRWPRSHDGNTDSARDTDVEMRTSEAGGEAVKVRTSEA